MGNDIKYFKYIYYEKIIPSLISTNALRIILGLVFGLVTGIIISKPLDEVLMIFQQVFSFFVSFDHLVANSLELSYQIEYLLDKILK